jgi:CheY-like chemotaxis protein
MSVPQAFRIYVVDDERVICDTLALILEQSGFHATAFINPLEALAAAESDPPDMVISDVAMPEITGVELAILLKKLCPSCKILLFSGQAATADLLQAARKQGYDFELLAKPVHPKDILRVIREREQPPYAALAMSSV